MIELLNSYRSGSISKKEEKILFDEIRNSLKKIAKELNKKYKVETTQIIDDIVNVSILKVIEKKLPSKNASFETENKLTGYFFKSIKNEFECLRIKKEKMRLIPLEKVNNFIEKDEKLDLFTGGEAYKEYLIPRLHKISAVKKFERCFNLVARFIEHSYKEMQRKWPKDYNNKNEGTLRKENFDCKNKIRIALLN
jgi:hypothetical protein